MYTSLPTDLSTDCLTSGRDNYMKKSTAPVWRCFCILDIFLVYKSVFLCLEGKLIPEIGMGNADKPFRPCGNVAELEVDTAVLRHDVHCLGSQGRYNASGSETQAYP